VGYIKITEKMNETMVEIKNFEQFEQVIKQMQKDKDYGILINNRKGENYTTYIIYNEKLKKMIWDEDDDKFDYKVEVDEEGSSFRTYKGSIYSSGSQRPDYSIREPSREDRQIKEEFVIGEKTVFSPEKDVISWSNYTLHREYENGKVSEETTLSLNETLFIQSPVEEGERDIPKIMELTGNEIELRPKQQPEPETPELDDQGDLPWWTVYKDGWLLHEYYKTKEGKEISDLNPLHHLYAETKREEIIEKIIRTDNKWSIKEEVTILTKKGIFGSKGKKETLLVHDLLKPNEYNEEGELIIDHGKIHWKSGFSDDEWVEISQVVKSSTAQQVLISPKNFFFLVVSVSFVVIFIKFLFFSKRKDKKFCVKSLS
jgi:hypothetical protein